MSSLTSPNHNFYKWQIVPLSCTDCQTGYVADVQGGMVNSPISIDTGDN